MVRCIEFIHHIVATPFVTLPYAQYSDARHTASVVEVFSDGRSRPFPDQTWNIASTERATTTQSLDEYFLNVQSAALDTNNWLWLLDTGTPKRAGVIPGGAKLVAIDLARDAVVRVIVFQPDVYRDTTYFNDVRVDARRGFAYVTDTGTTGLVVVNLNNGCFCPSPLMASTA